ncbi:MAG: hypothetical protein ACI9P8_001672 [Bacteroidia bacterium]|jgi:hypothetical protein
MKIVKLTTIILLIISAVSCETKQEAGRENISKKWKIETVTRGGVDDTQDYTESRSGYRISLEVEGGFQESFTLFGSSSETVVNGTWSLNSNVTALSLDSDFSSRTYSIDLLDENSMNITDQGSADDLKIFFVPA